MSTPNTGLFSSNWYLPSSAGGNLPSNTSNGYTQDQLSALDNTNGNGWLNDFNSLLGTATTGAANLLNATNGANGPNADQTPANGVQTPPGTNAAAHSQGASGLLGGMSHIELIALGLLGVGALYYVMH